jgi:hypothetical protein
MINQMRATLTRTEALAAFRKIEAVGKRIVVDGACGCGVPSGGRPEISIMKPETSHLANKTKIK